MKKFLISLFLASILLSCKGMPVNQSWLIPENPKKTRATLALMSVQVDMIGSRDSIEREAASLASLYFWKKKFKVIPASENPDYAAKIFVREREISRGLKVKRSLSVEVHIWTFNNVPQSASHVYERKMPVAVGRVIVIGEKSFSSSKIVSDMLLKSIMIAAKKLTTHKKRYNDA